MVTALTTHNSRTWTVRITVLDAPPTPRDYSSHIIHPDTVELSFASVNRQPPYVSSVRMVGQSQQGARLSAVWHDLSRAPAWVRPLIEEHRPR